MKAGAERCSKITFNSLKIQRPSHPHWVENNNYIRYFLTAHLKSAPKYPNTPKKESYVGFFRASKESKSVCAVFISKR